MFAQAPAPRAIAHPIIVRLPIPPGNLNTPIPLDDFSVASTELLMQRQLLDRVDRKFLVPDGQLGPFLNELVCHYDILMAGGRYWADYETCYFDTPDLLTFHEHLRGRRPRFKVRIRHHTQRQKSFLEIKRKTNSGKTIKARAEREFGDARLSIADRAFIAEHAPLPKDLLDQSVWTNFTRATFLGVESNERITVDRGLTFVRNGEVSKRHQLAIVELKQPRMSRRTPAARALHQMGLHDASMSKYCAGVADLHESARPRARRTMELRLQRAIR